MNVQLSNKKEAIFESTLKLVKEHGFHGTPMSQIATHANVATGTIYHYFSSKDELIVELFKYCRLKMGEHVFKIDNGFSYNERFFHIWNSLLEYYADHQDVFSFFEQFYSSPYSELVKNKEITEDFNADKMMRFFKEGVANKEIRNITFYSFISAFIGTLTFLVRSNQYGLYQADENDRSDLIEIIWNGVKNQ